MKIFIDFLPRTHIIIVLRIGDLELSSNFPQNLPKFDVSGLDRSQVAGLQRQLGKGLKFDNLVTETCTAKVHDPKHPTSTDQNSKTRYHYGGLREPLVGGNRREGHLNNIVSDRLRSEQSDCLQPCKSLTRIFDNHISLLSQAKASRSNGSDRLRNQPAA